MGKIWNIHASLRKQRPTHSFTNSKFRPGQTEPTKIVTHSKTPLGIAKRKEEWSRTPKEKETFSEIVRLLSLGNPECESNINLCDGPPYEPIFPKL